LCLWSKVPTAVLLASSFAFAVLLDREERRKPALCLGVLCVAGASFAATWGSFCAWLSGRLEGRAGTWIQLAMQPILYIHGLGSSTPAWRAGFYEWGLHSLSAAASLGPMLLAIALWRGPRDLVRTGRGRPGIDPIIPLFAFACLGLYEVFLGGARAYPKHLQAPIVSLAVMGALFLSKDDAEADLGSIPRAATWLAGLAAYYAAVVGDYLLTLNYDLRNAAYLGRTAPVLARFAEQWALYLLPLAVVAALRLCKGASFPWRRGLAIALLGSQLGLGAAQTRGGYDLHQAYGASTRDFLEVVRLLKESAAPGPIVADYGIADAAGLTPVRGFGSSSWNNPRDIESFIAEQKPKAVVYGIAIDTIDEMRSIRADERLQSLLSSHYSLRQAGSFFVWLRKEGP